MHLIETEFEPDSDDILELPGTLRYRLRRWATPDTRTVVTAHVDSGVTVVTVTGPMNHRSQAVCRIGLEAGLGARTPRIVLDLCAAVVVSQSRPLLRLLQTEAARHGVTLWLAGLSVAGRTALLRGDPTARHRTFDSVTAALAAAGRPA